MAFDEKPSPRQFVRTAFLKRTRWVLESSMADRLNRIFLDLLNVLPERSMSGKASSFLDGLQEPIGDHPKEE